MHVVANDLVELKEALVRQVEGWIGDLEEMQDLNKGLNL